MDMQICLTWLYYLPHKLTEYIDYVRVCVCACWHVFPLEAPPRRQRSASDASQGFGKSRLPGSTHIVCLAAPVPHSRLD